MNTSESTIVLVLKPDIRESLLEEMSAEWSRSPQLRLTTAEIQRRWQLESSTCSELLNVLVDLEIIIRSEDGTYRARA